MIDVSQMRRGNILAASIMQPKTHIVVESVPNGINDYMVEVKHDGYHSVISIEHLEYVPITEEWLLRFGFKPSFGIYLSLIIPNQSWGWSIISNKEKTLVRLKVNDDYELDMEFKYVHSLQNLYFALKETELEINYVVSEQDMANEKRICLEKIAAIEKQWKHGLILEGLMIELCKPYRKRIEELTIK